MAWPPGGNAHNNWDRAGGVPTDFRSFANAHMPHGHDGIGGMYEQMMGLHDNKNDEMEQIKWLGDIIQSVFEVLRYAAIAGCIIFAGMVLSHLLPMLADFLLEAAARPRPKFEKAALLALGFVAVPIVVAQAGLVLSGPVINPILGWKIYVYGSLVSATCAILLGAQALRTHARGVVIGHGGGSAEQPHKIRAVVSTIAGLLILGLLYGSEQALKHSPIVKGRPAMSDFTTDVDDPPQFIWLADSNHTGEYPDKNIVLMREYHLDLLTPKTTTLPIGAAYIRALTIAQEEFQWHVVARGPADTGLVDASTLGSVQPEEWLDKDEVRFEATSTSGSFRHSLFRIPDEIVVRVRPHTFEDGYVGAIVHVRSRGHLPDDRGVNEKRIKAFVGHGDW